MTTNNINPNMSNFEVAKARQTGIPFTTFKENCGWSSSEVKTRIIASRNGIEWQYGEGPNGTKEKEERRKREEERRKMEERKVMTVVSTRVKKGKKGKKGIRSKSKSTTYTPDDKIYTNDIAIEVFKDNMNKIGVEIISTPKGKGRNFIVRYNNEILKVRIRGTKEKNSGIYLIRAGYEWFEGEYAPDVFYIVSGVGYDDKDIHVVSITDAKSRAGIITEDQDSASFVLSYEDVKALHNPNILS